MAEAKQTPIAPRRPWYRPSLTTQILIGLLVGGVLGSVLLTLMAMRRSIVAPLKHDIAALRDEVEQLRNEVERLQGRSSGTGPTNSIREL